MISNVSEFPTYERNRSFVRTVKAVGMYLAHNIFVLIALSWGGVYIAAVAITSVWPH